MQGVAIEKSEPEATLANALYLVTSHSQGAPFQRPMSDSIQSPQGEL
jgi:hypothetical protein